MLVHWFIVCGVLVILLTVYAHYESSRAAYFRAKAREVQLRVNRDQHVTAITPQDVSLLPSVPSMRNTSNETQFDDAVETVLIDASQSNKTTSTEEKEVPESSSKSIIPPWKTNWEQIAVKFNELEAGFIMQEREQDDLQDYEDYLELRRVDEQQSVDVMGQHVLEEVNLDEDALAFLKQIGIDHKVDETPCSQIRQLDEEELEQDFISFEIEPACEIRMFPAVTATLCSNPSYGIHFVTGEIVEKYDDELIRLQDETGRRILAHKRFQKFNVGDKIICQITVKGSSWTCVQAWAIPQDELLPTG